MDKKPTNATRIKINESLIATLTAQQVLPGYSIEEAWIEPSPLVGGRATLNVVSPQLPAGKTVEITLNLVDVDGPHHCRHVSVVDVVEDDLPCAAKSDEGE